MADSYTLNVAIREDKGKGASRRLRRLESKVPAIIYGGGKAPQPVSIELKELTKQLENEAFYSHILTLNLAGSEVKAVLKDLQRHPAKSTPTHADFLRVDETHKIQMKVPLHFINEDKCHGVKMQGGAISHQLTEVEVSCLPQHLPEFIEVDMSEIPLGQTVHLSDLKLSEGVLLVELSHGADHDLPVAMVQAPKGGSADEATDQPSEEGGSSDE